MEDRLSVVKEAFNHMECDFLKYYSIHEDSICSMYVDEIRERFYEILISGVLRNYKKRKNYKI